MSRTFDRDNIWARIAWAMPRELVYWCAVRLAVHATTGEWSGQEVPSLKLMDALDRWKKPEKPKP
jgi:hypothetical protein